MTDLPGRVLFVSDIHMSSRSLYERGIAWWRPAFHAQKLLSFLQSLRSHQVSEVVFLGDVFDNWLSPHDEVPPSYDEILEDNPAFVEATTRLIERGIRARFTPGNHDWDLDAEALSRHIPGAVVSPSYTLPGLMHAEHGHQVTFFNASRLDPEEGRPLGYFLSRFGPELLPGGHSPRAVLSHIRAGALSAMHEPHAVDQMLKVLFGATPLSDEDVFLLSQTRAISLGEVRHRYGMSAASLPVRERYWRLTQRPLNLHTGAHHLARAHHVPLVILGHSHHARLRRLPGGALYLNTGAWCQPRAHVAALDPGLRTISLLQVRDDGMTRAVRSRRL